MLPFIYNSNCYQGQTAILSPFDRGLTLGDGVFDTLLLIKGKPIDFESHRQRLEYSLTFFDFPSHLLKNWISDIKTIWTACQAPHLAALRTTITRGIGPRGLKFPDKDKVAANILITLAPLQNLADRPLRAHISDIQRNQTSPISHHKTLCYLDNCMALQQAQSKGFEDALLLNSLNMLTGSSTASLFILTKTGLTTPPLSDGCLPGTRRQWILDLSRTHHLPCREASISTAFLWQNRSQIDAIFCCNSLSLLRPFQEIHLSSSQKLIFDLEFLKKNKLFNFIQHKLYQYLGLSDVLFS